MIPPLEWVEDSFLASALPVGHNAVKNILFRISSLLLQFSVLKILAYIACRLTAYTSFLMLAEDVIQKTYFLWSHGVNRHTWIVAAFIVLFPAAGLYDTWLWTLDAPGYIVKSAVIDAPPFSRQLLPNPTYLITIPGNATQVDLERPLSANLYTQGANVTLIGAHLPLTREVVPPPRNLSISTQPRLWLDDEGWSVGSDLSWPALPSRTVCPPNTTSETHQTWTCHVNNTDAYDLFQHSAGEPRIWWSDDTQSDSLVPMIKENIWHSLGPFGASAVMKQVFTVTKGRRRHTLLETLWKVTMATYPPLPLQEREILDLIRRMWNNDPDQVVNPEIKEVVDQVMLAQRQNDSVSIGALGQEQFAIHAAIIEYLTVVNPMSSSDQLFSVLRIRISNMTLLRSETLPSDSLRPFAPCPVPFANLATGGRVRDTTCAQRTIRSGTPTENPFLGQIDASTMVILTDILGDGNTNTSESAFDPQGLKWLLKNEPRLDGLIASRALILGGNCDVVQVGLQKMEAAISHLQLFLMLLPVALAILAYFLMTGNATSHYKHSFLAAVCATTHVSDNSCRRIGYLKNPPLITLKKVRRHVVIGTPKGGALANVGPDQVIAYSMITEPLDMAPAVSPKDVEDTNNEEEQEALPMLSPLRRYSATPGT